MDALPELEWLDFSSATAAVANSDADCHYLIAWDNRGQVEQLLADTHGSLVCVDSAQLLVWAIDPGSASSIFLGHIANKPYRVLLWSSSQPPPGHQWLGLRPQLDRLNAGQFSLAGRALQLAQWFCNHAFCGRCGRPTLVDSLPQPGEHQRRCEPCQLSFYPRITPCMIALITRGPEILLAYHLRASRPMFSPLAGHLEAGENLEQCVRREVKEEVGVDIAAITYVTSQSWPFPGQLMLAVTASYAGGELQPDTSELREAGWFRYDQLPLVPPTATVAGQLIDQYVRQCRQQWG